MPLEAQGRGNHREERALRWVNCTLKQHPPWNSKTDHLCYNPHSVEQACSLIVYELELQGYARNSRKI